MRKALVVAVSAALVGIQLLTASPAFAAPKDGDGTESVAPTSVTAGASTSLVFTYTGKAGQTFGAGAQVSLTVPGGWTAPNLVSGTPGFVAVANSAGTSCAPNLVGSGAGVSGQVITANMTCSGTNAFTITYGSGAGGAVTVPTTAGASSWSMKSKISGGTLTDVGSSPLNIQINPAAAHHLAFGQQPVNTVAGATITPSPTVRILDQFNNLTTSTANVTLAIGTNPASGSLSGTLTRAGVAGTATFSGLSINNIGTGYTLAATSTGLTGVTSSTFNITAANAVNGSGTMAASPTTAVAGSTGNTYTFSFAAPGGSDFPAGSQTTLVVPAGWTAPQTGSSGTAGFVALANDTGCAASIASITGTGPWTITVNQTCAHSTGFQLVYGSGGGPAGVTAATLTGVATFTTQTKAGAAGTLTNIASQPTVTVTPAAPDHLAFGVQPSNTPAGTAIAPAVTVQILDQFGNLTSSTASVTMAIGTNGGPGGVLSGTLTKAAVAGVATFNDLSINVSGTGYTLSATGSVTGTTSNAFDITLISAVDGDGTMTVSPLTTTAGSTNNTLAFTFTAPVGKDFPAGSGVSVQIPAGWTAPQTGSPSGAGYVTIANDTGCSASIVSTASSIITVSQACPHGQSFQILYGDTSASGPGATAQTGAGTASFAAKSQSGSGGTLTALGASPSVTVSAAAATQLVFTQSPGNSGGGVPFPAQPSVAVEDQFGNVRTGDNSTVVTLAIGNNAGGGTLACTSLTATASSGVASFAGCSIDKAGSFYTLTGASGGLTTGTSNAFNITSSVATDGHGTMSVSPTSVTAGSTGNTFTFTFTTPSGESFATGSQVSLDIPAGWSAPQSGSSSTAGFVAVLNGTTGNTCATAPTLAGIAGQTITVNITCDSTKQIRVVYGSGGGAGGAVAPNAVGMPVFTTKSKSGSGGSLVAISASPTVTINPAAANKLVFGQQPSNTGAGTAISPAVTVQILDQFNNLTTSTANVTIAIANNAGPGGVLSGTLTQAAVAGTATFPNLSIDTTGTGYTLAASSGALTGATSSPFNITIGSASDGNGTMTVSPTTAVAGSNNNTLTFTFTAPSSQDFPAGSQTAVQIPATWSAPQTSLATDPGYVTIAGADVSCGVLTPVVTGSGPWTITVDQTCAHTKGFQIVYGNTSGPSVGATAQTLAGTATFTAQSRSGSGGTLTNLASSPSVTVTAAAPAQLAFNVQPSNAASNATISPSPTVRILDQFGNLTSSTANVTVAIGTNPSSGVLSGIVTHAAVAGVATFSGLSINNVGTGYTLTADSAGLTQAISTGFNITVGVAINGDGTMAVVPTTVAAGATGQTFAFTFAANPSRNFSTAGSRIVLTVPAGWTAPQTANAAGAGYLTISGADASCGTVTPTVAGTGPWTVTITQTCNAGTGFQVNYGVTTGGGSGVTAPTTPATATFTTTSRSGASGSGTAIASSPTVTITAAAATKLVFTQQPASAANFDGGLAWPSGSQPIVKVEDQFNNVVTGDNSTAVTLGLGSNPGSATLTCTQPLLQTVTNGVATYTGCSLNAVGNGYTLTATSAPALTAPSGNSFNIVTALAADGAGTMTVSPTSAVAGATGRTFGYTFTTPTGKNFAAGSQVTLQVPAGWTAPQTGNAAGAGFVSLTGSTCATATINGVTGSGPWTITANVTCNSATHFTLNYGVTGSGGSGVTVPTATGSVPFPAQSAQNGGTLTNLAASPSITITPAADDHLAFDQQPTSTTSTTAITPAVTVRVLDQYGNLTTSTASVTMAFGFNAGSGTLSGTLSHAAAAGVATFSNLSIDNVASRYTLAASSSGLTGATSTAFDIAAGTAADGDGTMTVSPVTAVAGSGGNTLTFTFTAPNGKDFPAGSQTTVQIPAGWSAPSTTSTDPGYVTIVGADITCGSLTPIVTGTGPWTISVDQTCAHTKGFQIKYGDTGGGGTGATAQTSTGTATFTAQSKSGSGGTLTSLASSPQVTVTPSTADHLGFGQQPSTTVRNTAITPSVTVRILDASNNVVTTDSSTQVTLAIVTNPAAGTLAGTTTRTAVNGVATFNDLAIDNVGNGYTLGATSSPVLSNPTSSPFNITLPAATDGSGTMSVTPTSATAGSTGNTLVFTFTAPAASNFPAGSQVTLAVPAGWSAPSTTGTDPGYAMIANDTGCSASITGTTASTITVSQACPAGATFDVRYGDTSLTGPGATAQTGSGTATFLTKSKAGAGGTLTNLASSPSVTVNPAAADHLAFGQQPTNTVGGVAITPAVTVRVLDAFNNVVTADSTTQITVAIGTNPSAGVLSGTLTQTASSGVATFADLSINAFGHGYTLGASSTPAFTVATSNPFNIVAPAATSGQGTMTVSPTSVIAGATGQTLAFTFTAPAANDFAAGSSVTLTIPSAAGWTAPQVSNSANAGYVTVTNADPLCAVGSPTVATRTITVTQTCEHATGFKINYGGGSAGTAVGTTAGAAAFATQTKAGAGTLTAIAASPSVTVNPSAASKIVFTTSPSNSTGGIAFGTQPAVSVEDTFNNVVTGDSTSTVTLGIANNAGPGGILTCTSNTVTVVNGVAHFAGCKIDKTGTGYTLSASSSLSFSAAPSSAFNITVGPAAKITLSGATTNLTAGATRAITATVQDAGGNTTTQNGNGGNAKVTFAQSAGTGSVTGLAQITAGSGIATDTVTGNLAGPVSISASATVSAVDITSVAPVSFTVVPGAATKLGFTQQPGNSTAGVAFGTQPTVAVQDAQGNTVTGDNTTSVTLAISTNPGTGTLTCDQNPKTLVAVNGLAPFTGCSIDKAGTGYRLGATSSPVLTSTTTNLFNITAGPATHIALTGTTTNLTSGATRTITATIKDAFENTVTSGADSTLSVTFSQPSGTGSVSGLGASTAATGVATKVVTGVLAGPVNLAASATAAGGPITSASNLSFTVVAGAANKLAFSAQPTSAAAGQAISPAVAVQIQDAAGNLTTSTANVALAVTGGTPTLHGTTTVAAIGGVATFNNVSINTAGTGYTLTATSSGLTNSVSTSFDITAAGATKIVLSGSTANLTAGGLRTVTATIKDAFDNTVTSGSDSSLSVTFTQSGGTGSVTGLGASSASAGVATDDLTGNLAGPVSIAANATALGGPISSVSDLSFTVVAGPASNVVVGLVPTSIPADGSSTSTATATVTDAHNNPVVGDTVTFSTDGDVTFGSTTDHNDGTYTATITASNTADVETITGHDGAVTGSAQLTETSTATYPLASSPDTSFGGNVPTNAVDGSTGTWWQPVAAASSGDTRTLVIDRGPGAPSFLSVRTQWYSVGYQAIDYTIDTSPDGTTWTPAANITGNTSADRTDPVSQSDRYVRLVVSNWSNKLAPTPDAQLALLELTFTNTVPYPQVSSPDASYGGHVPAAALDGNTGTWWQPVAAASSGDTRTLVIDQGPGAPSFLSVRTQWYSVGYQAIDYTIDTSPNGSTWTPAATVVGNTSADRTDAVSQSDRYVRLVVSNWSNKLAPTPDAQLALLELTFTNTVPYPQVSSPDASYGGHVPAAALDGNTGTWWQPAAAASSGDTRTLVIDQGPGAPSFLSVRTQWYSVGYQAIDYTIDTSPNGSTWTPAATVVGNTSADRTDAVSQSDRYVRLVVSNWSNKLAPTPDAQLALLELTFTNNVPYPQVSSPDASYGGHVPAAAFDGNTATWWQPVAAASSGDTRTLVIDQGPGAPSFSSVRTQWYSVGYQGIDYTIDTSPNGSTWTPAATVVGNTLADRVDTVSQSDRYVRLVVSNWSNKLAPTPDAQLALLELSLLNITYPLASSPDTSYLGNVPANAVDGNTGTWWQPVAAASSGDTRTLVTDRGPGASSFSGVRTQWYSVGYQAIDYTIDTSPDGSTWTPAATVVGNTLADRTDPVSQSDRYVRIVVSNWSNKLAATPDAQLALLEITFTNILTYPQVSSPDGAYNGNAPANALDGNTGTWWQPVAAASSGDTRTIVIDRGPSAGSFSSVRMQWYSVGYQAIDYTIETSPDGSTWSPAASVVGNSSADRTDPVSQSDRYVRLVVSDWSNKLAATPDAQLALLELTTS